MMRSSGLKRGLRWLGVGFLAVLLTAMVALTWLVNDPQRVRGAIESVVSSSVDRPFRIEGGFDFDLGRVTRLRADRVRLLESANAGAPYLLQVSGFSGDIDLFSLLEWPLVFTRFQADDMHIHMQWDKHGRFNWPSHGETEPVRVIADDPALLPLVLRQGVIHNLRLDLEHPALTEELRIGMRDVRQRRGEQGRVNLSAKVVLDHRELQVSARLTPRVRNELIRAIGFDLQVQGALATLSANGGFSLPGALEDLDLTATLEAPSANELGKRLKLPLETHGAVRFDANLGGQGERVEADIKGFFGEYRLAASFHSEDLRSLQGLQVTAESSGPSTRFVGRLLGMPALPDTPYQFHARARHADNGVRLEMFRLDADGLQAQANGLVREVPGFRDIDLELVLEGDDFAAVSPLLGVAVKQSSPFSLKASVTGRGSGQGETIDASLELAGATARVEGSLSGSRDFVGSTFHYTIDSEDAQGLAAVFAVPLRKGTALQMQGSAGVTATQLRFPDIRASLGNTELSGDATLKRGSAQPHVELDGQLKGPSLGLYLDHLLPGVADRAALQRPFQAHARMTLASGRLHVESVDATVGQSRLKLGGEAGIRQAGVNLAGSLSIQGESLADLLGNTWNGALPDSDFRLQSHIQISPGRVHFTGIDLSGKHGTLGGSLELRGKGLKKADFDLNARGKSVYALLPPAADVFTGDIPFDVALKGVWDDANLSLARLKARLGEMEADLEGEVQVLPSLAAHTMQLQLAGPRLSDLKSPGGGEFGAHPFRVTAKLRGDVAEQDIGDLDARVGKSNLSGNLQRATRQGRPFFEVDLKSSWLDLQEVWEAEQGSRETGLADIEQAPLFSNQPLPFTVLDGFDANLRLQVDKLHTGPRLLRGLEAAASLQQGVLKLEKAQIDAAQGKFTLTGEIKPIPEGRAIDIELTATHARLPHPDMSQAEVDKLPEHSIAAQLSMSGNTPHELAASADGFAWILGGQGQARKSFSGLFTGDLVAELFSVLNPSTSKTGYSEIECQGLFFEIADGKLATSPSIILKMQQAIILANGTVDLASEKIGFDFRTIPRKGLGLSLGDVTNPLVRVAGSLRDPKVVPNPKGVLIEGGAAVATSGVSVLLTSLSKRWLGPRTCEAIAEQAVKARQARDPERVPDMQALLASVDNAAAQGAGSAGNSTRASGQQESTAGDSPDR